MALETYATFASDDLLRDVVSSACWPEWPPGVTRRWPSRWARRSRTRPPRRLVRRCLGGSKRTTATALEGLVARDLGELAVAAMMIDGIIFAGQCCVVALAICTDGTKVPVGLWLGDTENKTVVTHLLADLSARGLDASGGLLFVLDGSKALAAGVRKVFGDAALIQRCTLHKRRNVTDHLPKDQQRFIDAKLAKAFNDRDPVAGLRAAKQLAKLLEDVIPTPPPVCGRGWRRCSPCAGSAFPTGWPVRSPTPTPSSR